MCSSKAHSQTFSKARRLRKRRDFVPIQDRGSRIMLPSCIVLLAARGDDRPARLGMTVTRKFGGAVVRNRAKRLMRELFRRAPHLFPDGIDIVVIPKTSAARSLSYAGLQGEWQSARPLIAARAGSLRRELAERAPATQTPASKARES
jgi:ribonuclease P protein component